MTKIEIQVRETIFYDLLAAELVRSGSLYAIARDALAELAKAMPGGETILFDRFEIVSVAPEAGEPELREVVPVGRLLLRIRIDVHLTTFSQAQAGGHLGQPQTTVVPLAALVAFFLPIGMDEIRYRIVGGDALLVGEGAVPLGLLGAFEAAGASTAIFARDGVVVICALAVPAPIDATAAPLVNQEQLLLDEWRGNRLGDGEWVLRVDGQLFADGVAKHLNTVAKRMSDAITNPEIEVETWATPHWASPVASAHVVLNAVDAVLLVFDATATASVGLKIQVPAGPSALDFTLRISWQAEDIFSDLGFDFVQDQLTEMMNGQLEAPSLQYQKSASGPGYVEYSRHVPLSPPRSPGAQGTIASLAIDADGIILSGRLIIKPRPSATWSASGPVWRLAGNCNSPKVYPVLHGPSVEVVGEDRDFGLWETHPPILSHNGMWLPKTREPWPGTYPPTLHAEFQPTGAPSIAGLGIPTSAVVCTSVGARWVDFGAVPARPDPDDPALLVYRAKLIADCVAVSDRWRTGILPLDFGVDPLPDPVDIAPLQEWLVLARGVQGVEQVSFTAVDRAGSRRRLGTTAVEAGLLRIRVLTGASEYLQVETGQAMRGPAPHVFHRWVRPTRGYEADDAETAELLDAAMQAAIVDGTAIPGPGSVVGAFRGRVIFGVAGPFKPLLSAARKSVQAPS